MRAPSFQTTRLLVVYLSLVALGVLLEIELSQDPPDALSSRPPVVEDPGPLRALREDARLAGGAEDASKTTVRSIPKSVSDSDLSQNILTFELPSGDPVNLYRDVDGDDRSANPYGVAYGSQVVSDGSVLTGNDASHVSRYKPRTDAVRRKIRVSAELNAFDELVNLLTPSPAHCLAVDTLTRPRPPSQGSRYRCYLHSLNQCENVVRGKRKRKRKRCPGTARLGYAVNPASVDLSEVLPSEDKTTQTVVKNLTKTQLSNSDLIKKSLDRRWQEGAATGGGDTLHKTITVNARCAFLEDLKTLRLHQQLLLDITFDLAGLNSLHKYEIIRKLVQELRWVLARGGYLLIRSSADGGDLQHYLQQEGLQRPLHVLTLLRR
nr:uncharacterized protein LOC123766975 [Procambarus clarkii]